MRCLFAFLFLAIIPATDCYAQAYLTGPYGPNGTYNLYEIRGIGDGTLARLNASPDDVGPFGASMISSAEQVTETFTGDNISGHLVRVDDAFESRFLFEAGYRGTIEVLEDGYRNFEPRRDSGTFGFAKIGDDGFWDRGSFRGLYMFEYETHLPGPLPPIVGDLASLTVPNQNQGGFNIREISRDRNCVTCSLESPFAKALEIARDIPEDAIVIDYHESTINLVGKRSPGRDLFPDGNTQFRSHDPSEPFPDPVTLIANGQFRVAEEDAGAWEFLVGSDDGFELLIRDESFQFSSDGSVSKSGITPYGSLQFSRNRSFNSSIGAIELAQGTYDLELLYWDAGGTAGLELSARGPNDTTFELLGSPTSSLQLIGGTTCLVPEGGVLGDFDGNGTVEFEDFLSLSSNFAEQVSTYEEGDANCDGAVLFDDFLILSANFGSTAGAATSAQVPEPSSGCLALCCVGILALRRR